jgi:prepilin-type N-terminal cleavage/methylation domain-containing protein
MFRKQSSNGMTLIEVIIAVALLGIISVSFLSAFSTYYRWVTNTKRDITQEAFSSQEEVEEAIKDMKIALASSPLPSPLPYDEVRSDISLFATIFPEQYKDIDSTSPRERTTAYKVIVNEDTTHEMLSWVGKARLPEAPVPVIDILRMVLVRNGIPATDTIDNFEYFNLQHAGTPSLSLEAENTLTENPESSFYRIKHEWYVSEPGYLIPIVSSDVDVDFDMGRIYPRFHRSIKLYPCGLIQLST